MMDHITKTAYYGAKIAYDIAEEACSNAKIAYYDAEKVYASAKMAYSSAIRTLDALERVLYTAEKAQRTQPVQKRHRKGRG